MNAEIFKTPIFTALGIVIMTMALSGAAHAELTAPEIMQRVYETKRVDDQVATLTFRFLTEKKPEQKLVYTMVWKNSHGEDNYDNKAMFFTEFPPDKKGIAYLGYLRPAGSEIEDDEWLYLPELRMVRRIAHREHHHDHDDDEFGNSLLTRVHLDPRPPRLDEHVLLNIEAVAGVNYYVIESRPKGHAHGYPYSKVLYWIGQEPLLPKRVRYFDMDGRPALEVDCEWTQVDGKWLWQRLTAVAPATGARTIMEISNIKINSGLSDRLFSSRTLMRGYPYP